MSQPIRPLVVGAVSYHPRVVTVWEAFRDYFRDRGLDVDYVLYSNYERLVEALLAGAVDLAWNTNTAYVSAEARLGGEALVLGMRDVDAAYATSWWRAPAMR
jgi:phosphonate transport system substrate-binding protein